MSKKSNGFSEFFKAALRDPKNVSTIFPTLRFLSQSLITEAGIKPTDNILELGCGSGAVTKHILAARNTFASYTGVEIDAHLVDFLKKNFPGERFIAASADNLKEHIPDSSVDVVISSLPWTLFPADLQQGILDEIVRVMKPGGTFTTFLCLHAQAYPGASRVKKLFSEQFFEFEKRSTVTRNIPPASVFRGLKAS